MKRLVLFFIAVVMIPVIVYAADLLDQTEMTTTTSDDMIYVVDDPGGTPLDKKVTIGNAIKGMSSTNLADTADILYETELDTFAELDAQIADETIVNTDDAQTLSNKTFGSDLDMAGNMIESSTGGLQFDPDDDGDADMTIGTNGIVSIVDLGTNAVNSNEYLVIEHADGGSGTSSGSSVGIKMSYDTTKDGKAGIIRASKEATFANSVGLEFLTTEDPDSVTLRMKIQENGNIGIGTDEALGLLHVNGNIYAGDGLIMGDPVLGLGLDPDADTVPEVVLERDGDVVVDGDVTVANEFYVGNIISADAARFVVDSNANVGIGSGNPGAKLDVNGEIRGSAIFSTLGNNIVFRPDPSFEKTLFQSKASGTWETILNIRGDNNFDQALITTEDKSGNQLIIADDNTSDSDYDHALQTNPTLYVHSITDPDTANDEWVSLTHDQTNAVFGLGSGAYSFPNGNMGIGSATPGAKLDVNGEIRGTAIFSTNGNNIVFRPDPAFGKTLFQDKSSGTWETVLNFRGDNNFDQVMITTEDKSGNQLIITDDNISDSDHDHALQSNPTLYIHSITDPDTANDQWLSFAHNQTNAVFGLGSGAYTFPNGNIGIGTTVASQLLHVQGGARITDLVSCDTIDTDANGVLSCGTDAGGGAGDSVTVNSTAADTTANFLDGDIDFTLADGGAGGPDDITATVGCTGCVDDTDAANDLTINSTALITSAVGIDAIGAVDFDIGSADVTDVTLITDGGSLVVDGTTVTGDASGLTITTDTNGALTLDAGGSGATTVNAGSGGVTISTDAGNADITLSTHGTGDVIVSNGNVGIGSTNPQAYLDVSHSSAIAQESIKVTNSDNTGKAIIEFDNDSATTGFFGVYGSNTVVSSLNDKTIFGGETELVLISDVDNASGGSEDIVFRAGGYNDSEEVMVIDGGNDRVGIGTTDPRAKLDVVGGDALLDMVFGELYVTGNSTAITTTGGGTYDQVTGSGSFDTAGQANGTTLSAANDDITIDTAGVYLVNVAISFSGNNSETYNFQVQKNNGATDLTNLTLERKLGTGGDVGSATISGLASFSANDTVELWVAEVGAGSGSVTITDANMSVVRIGN